VSTKKPILSKTLVKAFAGYMLVEFGFKADGTVEEAKKAFANLVSAGSFPQRVWNRLPQLQKQFSSRAPSPNPAGKDDEMEQFAESLLIPVGSDAAIEVPTRHRGIHPGTTHGV